MTRLVFFFLLVTSCLNLFAQNKDIEALTQLNKDWINSYPKKDAATLKKIFADDFVLINPKGVKVTGADIINNLPKQEIISAHIDSAHVRLLTPEVGLVTGWISFVLNDNGKETKARTSYQDIYVKRKEKWQAVSAHVTAL